jgi:hypothetical protein
MNGEFNPYLAKTRIGKVLKARPSSVLMIPVIGEKDPRGPDNNIRVWIDPKAGTLHIRVVKTDRCYKYMKTIVEDGYVEIVAK